MNKLAISLIASILTCGLLAAPAAAAVSSGPGNIKLGLIAALSCGCKKSCCEQPKCCEKKCCKPKCCEPKCCKPKCCEPCGKKKCCPAIPEYPQVCAHNHEDLQRDLVSRKHAPWSNPLERGR